MHVVQFLLPLRDNERRPFARADFEKVWVLYEVMVEPLDRAWWNGGRSSPIFSAGLRLRSRR